MFVAENPADHHVFLKAFSGVSDLQSTSTGITIETPRGEIQVMDPSAYRLHFAVEPPDVARGMRLAAIRFAVRDRAAARAALGANAAERMDKLIVAPRPRTARRWCSKAPDATVLSFRGADAAWAGSAGIHNHRTCDDARSAQIRSFRGYGFRARAFGVPRNDSERPAANFSKSLAEISDFPKLPSAARKLCQPMVRAIGRVCSPMTLSGPGLPPPQRPGAVSRLRSCARLTGGLGSARSAHVRQPNPIVTIGSARFGNALPLALIAGPCQLESRAHALEMASALKEIAGRLGIGLVYKTSFDKANRTSASAARGIGLDAALPIFAEIRETLGLPVLTDVHEAAQCARVAQAVDVLQIPAFLCRQTDLLVAAAETGRAVNVKKGQFLAPWDMANVVAKITGAGNSNVLVTERGASFGYNTLVSDMRALPVLAQTGAPVIFDATHSVQQPGGQGASSGGQREFVPVLARAAVAVGVAGVFIETHQDPDKAPSDGPNMIPIKELESLLQTLIQFDRVAKAAAGQDA